MFSHKVLHDLLRAMLKYIFIYKNRAVSSIFLCTKKAFLNLQKACPNFKKCQIEKEFYVIQIHCWNIDLYHGFTLRNNFPQKGVSTSYSLTMTTSIFKLEHTERQTGKESFRVNSMTQSRPQPRPFTPKLGMFWIFSKDNNNNGIL